MERIKTGVKRIELDEEIAMVVLPTNSDGQITGNGRRRWEAAAQGTAAAGCFLGTRVAT